MKTLFDVIFEMEVGASRGVVRGSGRYHIETPPEGKGPLARSLGLCGAMPKGVPGKPKSPSKTTAAAVRDVMGSTLGSRKHPSDEDQLKSERDHSVELTLADSIDAFREIQAIVEAQLGNDPVALKAAYRRQQDRNSKIDQKYPGAREASRADERGEVPYHSYALWPGAERRVGKPEFGRIALHPGHPSKAARAYEKGRSRTTALYARRVAAQEK